METKLEILKKNYNDLETEKKHTEILLTEHESGILHNALECYANVLEAKLYWLDKSIKEEAALWKSVPKRLKNLVGKKIRIVKVYDEYFKDVVGKVGTVIRVKKEEDMFGRTWILVTDIMVQGLDKMYNFEVFIGDDRYRVVQEEAND